MTAERSQNWARASRLLRDWHLVPTFVVLALVIPAISGGSHLFTWTTVAIWALFALGTNVLFGWSGLLSFGQAAFFGLGGYTLGLMQERMPQLDAPVLLLGVAAVTIVVSAVFATAALRTSGPEFAVLTLVLAQVFFLLTYRVSWLKGDDGIGGLNVVQLPGQELVNDRALWFYTITIVAGCAWLMRRLQLSTLGAAMRAVRDDPWRSAALGLPVRRIQVAAFTIGSVFSAIAGALMAQHQGLANPSLLDFTISGEVLVACLVGGLRSFWGPVIGAGVLIWTQEIMSRSSVSPGLYVGLMLLVIVLLLPGGITSLPAVVRRQISRVGRGRGSDDSGPGSADASSADPSAAAPGSGGPDAAAAGVTGAPKPTAEVQVPVLSRARSSSAATSKEAP